MQGKPDFPAQNVNTRQATSVILENMGQQFMHPTTLTHVISVVRNLNWLEDSVNTSWSTGTTILILALSVTRDLLLLELSGSIMSGDTELFLKTEIRAKG